MNSLKARLKQVASLLKSRDFNSFVTPVLSVHVPVFLSALIVGLFAYGLTVNIAYRRLYAGYRNAAVFEEILASYSTVPFRDKERLGTNATGEMPNQLVLFQTLLALGLETADQIPSKLSRKDDPNHVIFLQLVDPKDSAKPFPLLGNANSSNSVLPTVEVVTHLIQAQRKPPNDASPEEFRRQVASVMAALLAGQPGAVEDYQTLLRLEEGDPTQLALFRSFLQSYGPNFGFFKSFVFSSGKSISQPDVLRLLYRQMSTDASHSRLTRTTPPSEDKEWEQYLARDKFCRALLSQLDSNPSVKRARALIAYFQGYEQCCMWIIFFWMLALLSVRRILRIIPSELVDDLKKDVVSPINAQAAHWAMSPTQRLAALQAFRSKSSVSHKRKRIQRLFYWISARIGSSNVAFRSLLDATEAELIKNKIKASSEDVVKRCRRIRNRDLRSRWLITWAARALPAVGFIGTVRGIAGALSKADSIVLAQSVSDQASAITQVSGTLAIAFTTTFIALVFGLITSILSDGQEVQERELMDSVEAHLDRILSP